MITKEVKPRVQSVVERIDIALIKYIDEVVDQERDRGNFVGRRAASKILAIRLDANGGLRASSPLM